MKTGRMERIAMNQEERDWLEWLKRVQDGVVTQRQAAVKMGVSDRWVRKLLARMQSDGDRVVVHGLRGRSSNRQIDAQTQERTIVLLKQPEWHDFGPTFASEQLTKRHSIDVSKETVRGWMVAAGLWKAHPRKLGEAHFWRARRSGYGELVQWDTSNHDWLEGRGEVVRYLVKWIDDATSRSGGRFVLHDGTRENMGVLWEYVEGNGRMVDLYTDRAGIFMVAPRAGESAQQRQHARQPVPGTAPPALYLTPLERTRGAAPRARHEESPKRRPPEAPQFPDRPPHRQRSSNSSRWPIFSRLVRR